MALSAAKLLKLLQDAQAKIKELEAREPEIVTVYVDRVIEVQSPNVEVVYRDNPEHIETIKALQEKLCQFTSQSDS